MSNADRANDLINSVRMHEDGAAQIIAAAQVYATLAVADAIEAEARAPLEARIAALERVVKVAQFPRNTRLGPDIYYEGEWVAVPREDFDRLRAALTALTAERMLEEVGYVWDAAALDAEARAAVARGLVHDAALKDTPK